MGKRIAIAFLVGVALAAAFVLGYMSHRNGLIPLTWRSMVRETASKLLGNNQAPAATPRGDMFPLRTAATATPDDEAILSIGYLQASKPATETSGVTLHDTDLASKGLNLYTSGHAPEAVLMDMDGRVLHTWRREFASVWPVSSRPDYVREASLQYWRRAYLYPNGDLLAIFEGIGLIKVDKDSNLLWSYRGGCHHDVFMTPSGDIYVLTSELVQPSWLQAEYRYIDNSIAVLDAKGQEKKRVSMLDCFRNSAYAPLLKRLPKEGDLLHVNTLTVLSGSHTNLGPAFAAGNVLVSVLGLDAVAVIDIERQTVPWVMTGMWHAQHQPELLDNGNILVFDNRGAVTHSRVLEVNPLTQEVVWQYPGDGDPPFYSEWCGSSARLPNGNTLITETDNGRALEVTPDHRIAWEFVNPNQLTENGATLVAALFEVVRLPEDYCASWLPKP
ncbi:MAG: arylsulfotransferase family protein [Candidatus Hydrogenedentes bacterium]|nr:arylsulfotransferase family protein [Candidatus Hydrogenedentota bacterium]